MKKLTFSMTEILLLPVIIFTMLNSSFAQKSKSIKENTTIDLNGFSVVSPSGDDWKYFITPDKDLVEFTFESSDFLTGKENTTIAAVLKDSVFSEIDKSEEVYAEEFLEETLNSFKSNEVYMKIRQSRKFDTTVAGHYFFSMYLSADDHGYGIPSTYVDCLFSVYFPDNFKKSRTFYRFLITSYYNLPTGNKKSNESDLKPVFSLMKSFRIKESVDLNKDE